MSEPRAMASRLDMFDQWITEKVFRKNYDVLYRSSSEVQEDIEGSELPINRKELVTKIQRGQLQDKVR